MFGHVAILMSSMHCVEGNIKTANYVKKWRRHVDKMNVDRNIKLPDLISSTLLLPKSDFC